MAKNVTKSVGGVNGLEHTNSSGDAPKVRAQQQLPDLGLGATSVHLLGPIHLPLPAVVLCTDHLLWRIQSVCRPPFVHQDQSAHQYIFLTTTARVARFSIADSNARIYYPRIISSTVLTSTFSFLSLSLLSLSPQASLAPWSPHSPAAPVPPSVAVWPPSWWAVWCRTSS